MARTAQDLLNPRIVLRQPPKGLPQPSDFNEDTEALKPPQTDEMLCETLAISLDPYIRSVLAGRHLSGGVDVGGLIPGEAISRVVESNIDGFDPGQLIARHSGWQTRFVTTAEGVRKLPAGTLPPSLYLGVLGMPGLTAYAGMTRLSTLQPGSTVVVSAAAGPVGSTVGQIARILGTDCRVVGIAGSPEKCAWVTDKAGFDSCIDYRREDLRQALDQHCPDGIDLYFDNVGGDTLQAVMERLKLNAQVILCGLMEQYNDTDPKPRPGPNPGLVIRARATLRGLVVYDHEDLREQMVRDISGWIESGQFNYREDVTDGLLRAPEAFVRLMQGKNFGKVVVRVAE